MRSHVSASMLIFITCSSVCCPGVKMAPRMLWTCPHTMAGMRGGTDNSARPKGPNLKEFMAKSAYPLHGEAATEYDEEENEMGDKDDPYSVRHIASKPVSPNGELEQVFLDDLREDPNNVKAMCALANLFKYVRQDADGAEQWVLRAMSIDPNFWWLQQHSHKYIQNKGQSQQLPQQQQPGFSPHVQQDLANPAQQGFGVPPQQAGFAGVPQQTVPSSPQQQSFPPGMPPEQGQFFGHPQQQVPLSTPQPQNPGLAKQQQPFDVAQNQQQYSAPLNSNYDVHPGEQMTNI